MLNPARAGRIASRSSLRLLSAPPSLRAATQFKVSPSLSISQRVFSSLPRLRQNQATAPEEEGVADDSIKHAPPELTQFKDLADHGIIHPTIIHTITNRMNIHTMTDVQRLTINECLDGADVIAQAKTGTGKTIAFLMPIIQRMMRDPTLGRGPPSSGDTRALIISPTRELAEQIAAEAQKIVAGTRVQVQTAVGGTQKSYHLRQMQQRGCHLLVGTPGRIKDLLSDRYSGITLDHIQTFVLDEADRLLDIGFAPDIEEIQSYMPPADQKARQTLMFSATVPKSVVNLVRQILKPDFKFIRTIDPDEAPTHERIPQKVVYMNGLQNLVPTITEIATNALAAQKNDPENNPNFKAIVFLPSVAEVTLVKEILDNLRLPNAGSGNMFQRHPLSPCRIFSMSSKLTQRERTHNSESFRKAESAILVSSDVTARGMDFPNVSHVIQVGMPQNEEAYVHRIGRTGRAGKSGMGYLLLQQDDRSTWERNYARDLKLEVDDSLHTAKLDMRTGANLPADVADILHMVESGVRQVPFSAKADAYRALIGVMNQSMTKRDKRTMVEIINDLSRYGWGLQTPPKLNGGMVAKLGLSGVPGIEIDDSFRGGRPSGRQDGRSSFGNSRNDRRDPFGHEQRGVGVSRGFGGGDRSRSSGGSYGGSYGGRGGDDFFGR